MEKKDTIIDRIRQAAENGNADAQYELGCRYVEGNGVPKDTHQGYLWWQRAAQAGCALAMCALGWGSI